MTQKTAGMRTYTLDASKEPLGRVAAKAAVLLMGKDRATFERHKIAPVEVKVIKAGELKLTGKKWKDKIYYRHSGYLGHLKKISAEKMREKDPRRMVYEAVTGMLPKNKLRKVMIKNLKIYKNEAAKK